jgi:hypothetical protein
LARSATPGDAVVSGHVLAETGAAVPDGYVSLTSAEGQLVTASATDERGQFVLRGLAPGSYRLQVAASGQETLVMDVLIGDKNSTYNLGELRLEVPTLAEVEVMTASHRRWWDPATSAAWTPCLPATSQASRSSTTRRRAMMPPAWQASSARAPGVLTVYENLFETQVVGAAVKYRF